MNEMNEFFKLFSNLPKEEKTTLISGIIDNQKLLLGKEILQTNKEAGEEPEVDYRTFESICLVELASQKMLEIKAKQKRTEVATQVHYPANEVEITVDCHGLSFSTGIKPYWRMETKILFK